MKSGKRQIKIIAKHFPRAYNKYVIFPEIKLSGKWLQDIGFDCGKSVIVSHKKNKITIMVQKEGRKEE